MGVVNKAFWNSHSNSVHLLPGKFPKLGKLSRVSMKVGKVSRVSQTLESFPNSGNFPDFRNETRESFPIFNETQESFPSFSNSGKFPDFLKLGKVSRFSQTWESFPNLGNFPGADERPTFVHIEVGKLRRMYT